MRKQIRLNTLEIVQAIIIVVIILVILFPIYWLLITSLKTAISATSNVPTFIPFIDFQPSFESYEYLTSIRAAEVVKCLKNSILSSLFSASISIGLGIFAGYGLARFQYKKWKNEDIGFWFLSLRILPPAAVLVPYYLIFNFLRMLDNLLTISLLYAFLNLPITVWMIWSAFQAIPKEIEEAASIDGCTSSQILLKISLPLAKTSIAMAFLLAFVFSWNEFFLTMSLTYEQAKTLPVFIAAATTSPRGVNWSVMSAISLFAIIPPLIVAIAAQRYILKALTFGAIRA
jgi:multiple sugar transport system permease protein